MKALAFDQATSITGWAAGTEQSSNKPGATDAFYFGSIKTPKRDEFGERLAFLWRHVAGLIDVHQPDIIGYEEPYFPIQGAGGAKRVHYKPASGFLPAEVATNQDDDDDGGSKFNPETLKQLQMVKGVIITQAALRGIPVRGCAPSQWRLSLLGFGRAPKGEKSDFMKHRVLTHLRDKGFDVVSNDISDAIGVLHHTLHGKEAQANKQGDLLDMARGGL